MPYDLTIAERLRRHVGRLPGCAEKKMFGGVAFLLHGNMCVGVWKEFLIVRVGPDAYDEALGKPGVHEFEITGRPMRGWIMVDPAGARDDIQFNDWIDAAVSFVRTLPRKAPRPKGRR